MKNGNCYFLLTEDGQPKELVTGDGHDISFYADCFVIMGFAEYAISSGDFEAYSLAKDMMEKVEQRLADGTARSEPYPVPEGYGVHGYKMIVLNTLQSLYQAASTFGCTNDELLFKKRAKAVAQSILEQFCDSQHRIREVLNRKNQKFVYDNPATLLQRRFANPGHSVESLWFILTEARRSGDQEMISSSVKAMKKMLEMS